MKSTQKTTAIALALPLLLGTGAAVAAPASAAQVCRPISPGSDRVFCYEEVVDPEPGGVVTVPIDESTPPERVYELGEFADVAVGHQFHKEIEWAGIWKISTGWPDHTFRPDDTVKRDAMAAFIYRLTHIGIRESSYTPPAVSPFTDVSTDNMYYKEIAWLAEKGISTGWTEADGSATFRPYETISRDAMAAFLYRMTVNDYWSVYTAPAASPFADVAPGVQFYKEMSWMADTGISTGWAEANGTKTYRPGTPVRRDAMAAFLYRMDLACHGCGILYVD